MDIEPEMQKPGSDTFLLQQLRVADKLFLRVWLLSKTLNNIGIMVVVALLGLLAYLSNLWWSVPLATTWGIILSGLFVLVLGATIWKPVNRLTQWHKTAQDILIGLGMLVVGSLLAKLHLKFFDKLFLEQGRVDKIRK